MKRPPSCPIAARHRLASAAALVLATAVQAESPSELKLIYFGNSLTENSQPELHAQLGQSADKTWEVTDVLGAGWQVNFHRFALLAAGLDISLDGRLILDNEKFQSEIVGLAQTIGNRGDLTIDPATAAKTERNLSKFVSEQYDGMLLQFFSAPLHRMVEEHRGVRFPQPRDIGELPACIDMIRMYLAMNPGGTVYIYQNWPHMPETLGVPPAEELPAWARREGARLRPAEFPDRTKFDYEHEWLVKKIHP